LSNLTSDAAEANGFGISATPAFIIAVREPSGAFRPVKRVVGAQPYAVFAMEIDELLTTRW